MVTGEESVLKQVRRGCKLPRIDITSSLEKADSIITQQAVAVTTDPSASILILADDTDVFASLIFHYGKSSLLSAIYMQSPVHGHCCIDIRATYKKHNTIAPDLLSIHAISGCDTVAATYGIGKITALNFASKGYHLHLLGDKSADISKVVEQATSFMAACYGITSCSLMTECRQCGHRKLANLCLLQNCAIYHQPWRHLRRIFLRAHLQVAQRRAALTGESPAMDPIAFGWEADQQNKSLIPRNMSSGTPYAPEHVLKLVRCGCQSERSCRGGYCGCMGRQLPCATFCACLQDSMCKNPFNTSYEDK